MNTLEGLISTPEYWMETIQNNLFRTVLEYQTSNGLSKADLAVALNCTPRLTTQLLNGTADCSMSKLVDIVTRMKLCPNIEFTSLDKEVKKQH